MDFIVNWIKRTVLGAVCLVLGWGGYYAYRVYIKKDAQPGMAFLETLDAEDSIYPQLPRREFGGEMKFPFEQGWPYQVVALPGATATQTYSKLCAEGRKKGFWPVMLGAMSEHSPKKAPETFAQFKPVAEEILAASQLVPLEEHVALFNTAYLKEELEYASEDDPPETDAEVKAASPDVLDPQPQIWAHKDLYSDEPLLHVFVAIVPCRHSYEAPAYLNWVYSPDVPSPDVQVAFLKQWHERWGAELVAVAEGTMQFVVARPPQTYEEALELAYQQHAFNIYLLEDGYASIRWHAKSLIGAKVWIMGWE